MPRVTTAPPWRAWRKNDRLPGSPTAAARKWSGSSKTKRRRVTSQIVAGNRRDGDGGSATRGGSGHVKGIGEVPALRSLSPDVHSWYVAPRRRVPIQLGCGSA